MKRLTIFIILVFALTVTANSLGTIFAWPQTCQGEHLYQPHEFEHGIAIVKKQGCQEVRFEQITENFYLIYGVKVVRRQY